MLRTTRPGDTLEWPEDDKTGDGLPPLPEPDGSAEVNKRPHPGGGYEYDEVDAWSEPLVRAAIDAAVARERDAFAQQAIELMRNVVADAVARERERWEKVYRISIPTATMEQEIATHVRRAAARERELCAQVCDARDMGDGSREDQEARRCAEAIRGMI